jgi:hypothetical protein
MKGLNRLPTVEMLLVAKGEKPIETLQLDSGPSIGQRSTIQGGFAHQEEKFMVCARHTHN